MSYLTFHLVFILPVILVLVVLLNGSGWPTVRFRAPGLLLLCLVALAYTTPWDNHLVARGIWTYGEDRVIEGLIMGVVPIEEYAFFILQPLLAGLFLLWYARNNETAWGNTLRGPLRRGLPATSGGTAFLTLALAGAALLRWGDPRFTYLALILVWACPVLAFQWFHGGGTLIAMRPILLPAVITPTVYLWIVDMIAIEWTIWVITPATSTGWFLFALPLEEAVFFLLTNLMVIQGLVLVYQHFECRAARRHTPPLRSARPITSVRGIRLS